VNTVTEVPAQVTIAWLDERAGMRIQKWRDMREFCSASQEHDSEGAHVRLIRWRPLVGLPDAEGSSFGNRARAGGRVSAKRIA
jgi:hypothetical protein